MAFPIVVSFITAAFCLGLGILWKMYDFKHLFRKSVTLAGFGVAALAIVMVVIVAMPNVAERWAERLWNNKGQGGGAVSEDLSSLMRKAEAKSMWDILAKEPHTFIYGKGLGAPYYWDEDYYPELFMVYPNDRHQFPLNIYSAGHSIWTYTLFSRGIIGLVVTLCAFFITMALSIRSAQLNSQTVMGPRAKDAFLIFFPFVAMWATLSESITRNPFDERFTGVLFGFLIAFPQFYFNRAFFLKHRELKGNAAPQIILDEEFVPKGFEARDLEPESQMSAPNFEKRTNYPGGNPDFTEHSESEVAIPR